jgi:dTDP-4-dehydrorhamnose reductase
MNKGDGTLLDEMVGILKSGGTIRAAYDQIFCPTLISDLINVVAVIQTLGISGVVNVCSPEVWSRYDLALALAREMGVRSTRVSRISLDDLGIGPKRPKNTSMAIERLQREAQYNFTPMAQCITYVARNWKR